MFARRSHLPVDAGRSLYVVPDRTVARLSYVPAGRTLHLIDIENLMGGPMTGPDVLRRASAEYRSRATVKPGDHVIVACNHHLMLETGQAWPDAEIRIGSGPDGADLELMDAVAADRWVAARFDRVSVGSGDGIFLSVVRNLRQWGIAVGVVSRRRSLASPLAMAADFVRYLQDDGLEEICA